MSEINHNLPPEVVVNESIDFLTHDRPPRLVGQTWEVKINPKKKASNFFGIFKKADIDITVKIADLSVDPRLVLDANKPLLSIKCDGETSDVYAGRAHEGVTTHLTDAAKELTLHFNPQAVADIQEKQAPQPKSYPITFKVQLISSTGELAYDMPVRINVSGAHVMTEPKVSFSFASECQSTVFNRSLKRTQAGVLKIANPSQLMYAPHLAVDVEIVVKKGDTSIPSTSPKNPFTLDFSQADAFKVRLKDSDPMGFSFTIPELSMASTFTLPVMVDYSVIGNPIGEQDGKASYSLAVNLRYRNINEPTTEKSLTFATPSPLEVIKNSQMPMLDYRVFDWNGKMYAFDTKGGRKPTVRLPKFSFLPSLGGPKKSLSPKHIQFIIANFASEGSDDAGIYIDNFSITPQAPSNLTLKILGRNKDGLNGLFKLKENPGRTFLTNSNRNKSCCYEIMFDGDRVYEMFLDENGKRNYNVTVDLIVSFDYYLDENADCAYLGEDFFKGDRKETFKGRIKVPLYQKPNDEWLAVDFGTSAIVAMYDQKVLDLHKIKNGMHSQDRDTDEYEVGTPFLSSNIVLRLLKADDVEGISQLTRDNHGTVEFSQQALFLSPTSYQEKANINTVIPCLKLIVGYDQLPNVENYQNYLYQYRDIDGQLVRTGLLLTGVEDGMRYEEPTPMAQIDTIFGEVYSELMRYYIRECIKDEKLKINRLVLTVPNTYTPRHLEKIKEIVHEHLGDLYIREIKFVSESDAVACYYLQNWQEINEKFVRNVNGRIKEKEYVLVYDIGAGTLDVTLFYKHFSHAYNKVVIDVLGKIGISKAGNYLDSLLAELLASRFEKMRKLSNPDNITEASEMVGALKLKSLIKNHLKPALNTPNQKFVLKEDPDIYIREDVTLDLDEVILSQPKFKKYIKEITDEFLDNFFAFFNIGHLEDFKIDTVLMSGRTAKLEPIKIALENKLKSHGSPDFKIIPVSFLNEKGSEFDKSKTIVVEGAIDYAASYSNSSSQVIFNAPALSANYGIIYRTFDGSHKYVELLNPREYNNVPGCTYQTRPITVKLGGVRDIKLVQTFSAKTEEDWCLGNREYITVMAEASLATIPGLENACLSMLVDEDGYLTLQINGQQLRGLAPSKIDINSASNARSLWPTKKSSTPQ